MRVIIAGGRDFEDKELVRKTMGQLSWNVTEVVSGTARGADRLGEEWATMYRVPIRRFPAQWNKFGKSAGYRRNANMARYANALVAFWDGESRGTKHMIDLAKREKLKIVVVAY